MKNKKIKLKKKKNRKAKIYFFIIVTIMIICSSIYLIKKISLKISNKVLQISEIEATKISKKIIRNSTNNTILEYLDSIDIFKIERDKNNTIKMIDLDTKEINKLLTIVNSNINKDLKELEFGNSNIIDIGKSIITNEKILSKKHGIIFEIPIGMATENVFINNLGPKIPIKILPNGELISKVETKLENYGINSSLLKIYININVTEQIIMPVISKEINISTDILIATKMINGEIPSYYFQKSD